MLDLLWLIVKCPFNKIKILRLATIAFEKSFLSIDKNQYPPYNSREQKVPLIVSLNYTIEKIN